MDLMAAGEHGAIDWSSLAAHRERWMHAEFGATRLWPARLAAGAQANLAAFASYLAERAQDTGDPPMTAVAMTFFGPSGTPPPQIWTDFVSIHRKLAADIPDPDALNPFDLMLAFGCGWRRTVARTTGGWEGRWEVSYASLINQVTASLFATNRLLVEQFPQFGLTEDDLLELPGDFAVSLLTACDCGHHVRGCGHACGRECCFPRHDLARWNPSTCHLRPFIDQAVRGTAVKQILGAAFAESLTYVALEREGRILRRRVEFKRCPGCQALYDEAMCPTPGCELPTGAQVARVARANWLIRPEHEGGNYREVVRWVCGGCGNLSPLRFKLREALPARACPICGWSPSPPAQPARITVWARLPPGATQRSPSLEPAMVADPYEER